MARVLRRAFRHGRDQQHLLPAALAIRGRGLGRAVAARVRFAVKASRYLTHVKRLREMKQGVRRYLEAIKPLVDSPKMGPILWQLPANFKRDDERLGTALEQLPSGQRHCFEFRHESWFVPEVYE